MPNRPELTAIVVAWNVREQVQACLRSLERSTGVDLHVIVVDNASSDGTAEAIRTSFPNVRLIANDRNLGFAAAVNQGLANSRGHVVLINPDLTVKPDTLQKLLSALERDPHVGIIGSKILFPDGQLQPSIRRFPTAGDLVLTLLKLPNFFPQLVKRYAGLDLDYEREQAVDQVMGSCFLIRRQALDAVGKFDESFFIWFEEVDYCKRAAELGWKTLYVPSAVAIHEKGASFQQLQPLRKHRLLVQSMTTYTRKHLGLTSGLFIWLIGQLTAGLAGLQQLLRLRKPASARQL